VDANREHLQPWMPWAGGEPEPTETIVQRIRHFRARFDLDEEYLYGIFNLKETMVLGGTALHPRIGNGGIEIGYWIHFSHTRQGLATEVTAALTKVAFEIHHLQRVEIHCEPDNLASASIPRKLGFIHEATLKRRTKFADNDWRDSMIWTVFESQYRRSPSANINIRAFDVVGNELLK
jgi:RimJ/RimL family protein N-acetyltransferase